MKRRSYLMSETDETRMTSATRIDGTSDSSRTKSEMRFTNHEG